MCFKTKNRNLIRYFILLELAKRNNMASKRAHESNLKQYCKIDFVPLDAYT